MTYVLVQHKIGKWSEFEGIFRDDEARRRMLGSTGGRVFRNVDEPDNLIILFEWDSIEGARKFVNGLETHEAMEWATSGVWSRVTVIDEVLSVDA